MATTTNPPLATGPIVTAIPRLENGDHLTRAEFERRYRAFPHLSKAELIDGVVYMPSPVHYTKHGQQTFQMIGWLANYQAATPGIGGGDNTSVRLDLASEVQPDVILFVLPPAGGQARIDEDGYVSGAPDLAVEVAASSISYDLHEKIRAYQRNGVREYVVWRVDDQAIDWFVLRQDHFEALPVSDVYKSEVFPGLWLDQKALIAGDLSTVFQALQQGLTQPDHAAFVQRLKEKMTNSK
jgi:Uma2 family endonuclease